MRFRFALFGFALLLGTSLISLPAQAQRGQDDLSDLGDALQTISKGYADNYVQPVTDAFGAGMNSGLFRTADVGNSFIPGLPVDVYLGVSVSGTLTSSMETSFRPFGNGQTTFQSDGQTFSVRYEERNSNNIAAGEAPTVLGETEPPGPDLVVRTDLDGNGTIESDEVVSDPKAPQGLLDTNIAPIVVPQLGIGSVAGTDLQVRYFPKTTLSGGGGSYGKVGLFGIAVRHDIDQWFPAPLPFQLAVQGAWNQFSLENDLESGGSTEVLDASGWAFNVQASKGIPVVPVVLYGGLQYEKFNVDYDYTLNLTGAPNQEISLSQTSANNFRGLAGLSISIPPTPVRINVDYAIGSENNVVTTGLGVRL
jgi:hypothetical protein